MKRIKLMAAAAAIVAMACGTAMATPSTQIWIPSTDAKDFKNIHIDIDNYARFSGSGEADTGANMYNLGLSAGVLPLESLKLEVGVDFLKQSSSSAPNADNNPFYFNAKLVRKIIVIPQHDRLPVAPAQLPNNSPDFIGKQILLGLCL